MDADEFLSHFWDKLENELKEKNLVKENFGGILNSVIESQECRHESVTEEEYLIIRVEIIKNLKEA